MPKEFKNKKDQSTIVFYENEGAHFYKHVPFRRWMRKIAKIGPFKNEGDALLSACMSHDFKFSEFAEVRRS